MAAFSGPYEAFIMDSVGISEPISSIQDHYLADREYIEFAANDEVISSEETLLYWHESTIESLGLQEIIDPIMINEEQFSAAVYCSSVGDKAVYPENKSTVGGERKDCDKDHLQEHTPGDGKNHEVTIDKQKCTDKPLRSEGKWTGHTVKRKMKKRKTDQYVGRTVLETYLQKSKRDRRKSSHTSSASKNRVEESNSRLSFITGNPPELPLNIVKSANQTDYIHVRARRGQATNSHSLAERARREKIRERMKVLQDLVPGCDKVTGKALLLEEIINYVQSLQKQVEFLSFKLACVVPLSHSDQEINGHPSSTHWSNLKQVEDIHDNMMHYKQ